MSILSAPFRHLVPRHPLKLDAHADILTLRPEKIEDAKARAAIKAQIEADKRERAEKAAREKALREGKTLPESSASGSSSTPAAGARPGGGAAGGTAGKDFKETRLQIRLASGGQPYTTTLSSDASELSFYCPCFLLLSLGRLTWAYLITGLTYIALREVAEFLAGQVLAVDVETVSFAQHFPRFAICSPFQLV